MTVLPYILEEPENRTTSVVFASPHSGMRYELLQEPELVLDDHTIRSSEDAFVDRLFSMVPESGAPLLLAQVPRAYVDFNRAADELDPALIQGIRRNTHNPRVSSGLGVIPRVVAGGRAIRRGKITLDQANERLQSCWFPYHDRLQSLLDESIARFGEAILLDCHSMPHEALLNGRSGERIPEIVLGDRFGASASSRIVDQVEAAFEQEGFVVARNSPFAGAYSTMAYGRPARRQHAIQIEIDRSLYMDESRLQPLPAFDSFKERLARVVEGLTRIGQRRLPLAAE